MVFELNDWIAEESGIHLGDGEMGIYPNNAGLSYQFGYTGDLYEDSQYLEEHVIPLVYRAFRKMPSSIERCIEDHYMRLRYYSKDIVLFKRVFLDLSIGRKVDIAIPRQIVEDKGFLRLCVRGLFDTDGSIYFEKDSHGLYSIPVISISNTSYGLLKQVSDAAWKFGLSQVRVRATHPGRGRFKRRKTLYDIHYKGLRNFHSWMRVFGMRNHAKLSKIEMYIRFGECPPGTSHLARLRVLCSED